MGLGMIEEFVKILSEIFVDPSDKAKGITILVSSVVALSMLLLNQWFINSRSRREIKREKIEELYLLKIEFYRNAQSLIKYHFDGTLSKDPDANLLDIEKVLNDFRDVKEKMYMIITLYFRRDREKLWRIKFYRFNPEAYSVNRSMETELDYSLKNGELSKLDDIYYGLGELCRNLMNKHTNSMFRRFFYRVEDIFNVFKAVLKNLML